MQRRRFLRVLAAGSAFVLGACDRMPEAAIAAWQGPDGALRDPRLRALAWALLAPNPHNMQPWIADVRTPDVIRLSLDPTRLLAATDPFGRQILIGCGAFLELLRQGAAQEGRRADLALFPHGEFGPTLDDRVFAEVRLGADPDAQPDPLFAAVKRRRTNRAPYDARVPAPQAVAALRAAAQTPGIDVQVVTDSALVETIGALAADGYRSEFATPAAFAESARVIRIGADEIAAEPSGIVLHGPMIWWGLKLGLFRRADVFDANAESTRRVTARFVDAMAATPAWVYLASADNGRRTQIAAGRAYARLDLAAAAAGIAIHPNSQTLQEFAEMRQLFGRMRATLGVKPPATVQMLARLGYAQEAEPAPRRPLARLLRT
jgi:nitroreductase